MAVDYTFYDKNWTVLKKIKWLEQWFKSNALNLDTLSISSYLEGNNWYITISGTNYDGETYTSNPIVFDTTDLQKYTDEQIAIEKQERIAGDEAIQQDLDEEKEERYNNDNTLEQKINELFSELSEAITNETSERKTADEELQSQIDEEIKERSSYDEELAEAIEKIQAEITGDLSDYLTKEDAEAIYATKEEVAGDFTILNTAIGEIESNLSKEVEDREKADEELAESISTNVANLESNIESTQTALEQEIVDLGNATQTSIDELKEDLEQEIKDAELELSADIDTLDSGLAQEIQDRKDGDASLQSNIDGLSEEVNTTITTSIEEIQGNLNDLEKTVNTTITEEIERIEEEISGLGSNKYPVEIHGADGLLWIKLADESYVFGYSSTDSLSFSYTQDGTLEYGGDSCKFTLSLTDDLGIVYPDSIVTYNITSSDESVVSIEKDGDDYIATASNEGGECTLTFTATTALGETFTLALELTIEDKSVLFANDSWETIAQHAEDGTASTRYSIGDTKTITCTDGNDYTIRIIGFNHDKENSITMCFDDRMWATLYKYNDSSTTEGGWEASAIRNNYLVTIQNSFPSELRAVLKTVTKEYLDSYDATTVSTCDDVLFLPSRVEIDLSSSAGDGGSVYEWFDGASASDRIRYIYSTGAADYWWTRTPRSASNVYQVSYTGGSDGSSASTAWGVVPFFVV